MRTNTKKPRPPRRIPSTTQENEGFDSIRMTPKKRNGTKCYGPATNK